MKWTNLDKMVLVIWILVLGMHALTTFAMGYQRTCGDVNKAIAQFENDPAARWFIQLNSLGNILFVLMTGGMVGGWFGYIRKIQFGDFKPAASFIVTVILFCALYSFVNDLALTVGVVYGGL